MRTSSTVVMPHSRFMQRPLSCQNGQSRYKSIYEARNEHLTLKRCLETYPEELKERHVHQRVQLVVERLRDALHSFKITFRSLYRTCRLHSSS